jgi:hypothetical protein
VSQPGGELVGAASGLRELLPALCGGALERRGMRPGLGSRTTAGAGPPGTGGAWTTLVEPPTQTGSGSGRPGHRAHPAAFLGMCVAGFA